MIPRELFLYDIIYIWIDMNTPIFFNFPFPSLFVMMTKENAACPPIGSIDLSDSSVIFLPPILCQCDPV